MTRLGVIGISDGNGHPYSWSAICNGYDPVEMESCGFPSIPRYLEKRIWPNDRLANVSVTHVWTQDAARAAHIARTCLIETIAKTPEDMIGRIDGLLLARDDAENHSKIAAPFLKSGIPVYLDKAAALSVKELDRLYALQSKPGLIFSGTALRFAKEFVLSDADRSSIGKIHHVSAVTPKSWDRYAIHIVEPVLTLLGEVGAIVKEQAWAASDRRALYVKFETGVSAHFVALGGTASPIALRIHGSMDWRDLIFRDSFSCFRAAIAEFVTGVRAGSSRSDPLFVRKAIDILERGRR